MSRADAVIALIAERQGGHISRAQLLKLGLSGKAIDHRIRIGRLIPVYPGVYAVGHLPTLPLDRAKGALLACGPEAALSHRSAAALWGFEKNWLLPFEIVVPGDRRRRDIRVHRLHLADVDIRTHLGVRTTSPARTILDIAPETTTKRLTRLVNDARLAKRLTIPELEDLLARNPRHKGAKHLKPLIEDTANPTRSQLEDDFKAFCETLGLPKPQTNVNVAGYEVDALFEAEKLIVELDGYATHSDRDTFEKDRDKDANTLAAGYATVRLTNRRMNQKEADRLRTLLAKRRSGQ